MKLKKVLCCFLAAAMTLSMVACGGNAGGSSADSDSGSKQETPVEDAGTEDAGEAKTADGLADDPLAELPDLEDVYAGAVVAGTPEMYSNVDLSSPCNINVYMVCDKPNDWDMVVEAINEYLTPFNTTMSATFISLADYQKLYPLALKGLDRKNQLFYPNFVNIELVDNIINDIFAKKVECIVCGDDVICSKIMSGLQAEGYRIPKDISIVSLYNSMYLECLSPAVTAVNISARRMGNIIGKQLINCLQDEDYQSKTKLDYEILGRKSTGKLYQA